MYTLNPDGSVTRDRDGKVIQPGPSEGADFDEYAAWIAEGNSATNADVVHVPQVVSPKQIRLALNRSGLRDAVEAALATMDRDTRDIWEFSSEIHRDNPLVVAMGQALGADLDQLFILAGSID